jgi:hypothetical protein
MQPNIEPLQPVDLKELATLLLSHYGIHDGLYEVAFAMQIAVGHVGPTADQQLPGAAFSIAGVGLAKMPEQGPNTVDAAKVNPSMTMTTPKATKKSRKVKAE